MHPERIHTSHYITIVAAISNDHAIGRDNQLPWHLPRDLRFFAENTRGKTIVMGRKTADSLPHPLKNRRNIVLTHQPSYPRPGFECLHSLEEVLSADHELMIIGGQALYELFLPLAQKMLITHVHTSVPDATAYFPPILASQWQVTSSSFYGRDYRHAHSMTFVAYDGRKTPQLR